MGISQVTAGQTLTALDVNQLPVVVSYLATGSGGASSTSEVVIGTFTIPAGDPTSPGGYWWVVHCIAVQSGSPSLTVRMRFGSVSGTILASGTGNATLATNMFQFQGWMGFEAIGSSGSFGCQDTVALIYNASPSSVIDSSEAVAINTTIANNIVVTAQFGASSASNTATTKFGSLYRL